MNDKKSFFFWALILVLALHRPLNSAEFDLKKLLAPLAKQKVKILKVLDGRRLDVEIQGLRQRICLIGLETYPISRGKISREISKDSGLKQKDVLFRGKMSLRRIKELIGDHEHLVIELDEQQKDQYGRYLVYAWIDDKMINEEMLKDGFAIHILNSENKRYQSRLIKASMKAMDEKRGLYSLPKP